MDQFLIHALQDLVYILHKKLSYRSGTARRTMAVNIVSTTAQLFEKWQL